MFSHGGKGKQEIGFQRAKDIKRFAHLGLREFLEIPKVGTPRVSLHVASNTRYVVFAFVLPIRDI